MGDPFSTASSAVGIISLGLQVCTQLVSYCQAWKDFGNDIQKLGKKAACLRVSQKQLRDLIEKTRLSDPETAADLEEKAMHLEQSVRKLQTKLDMCRPVLNDFSSKIRSQMKKATHIFRNDILHDMENDLDGIQQALQTALSMYVLNFHMRHLNILADY
ncbi:uncharacterized protein N7483_011647 [Penicillium malachiteum]|uniref:uncharacterized protein n=1 Tax=Penicillium malachiteum TaxID=1324776 RepID=UPI00254778C8|nr:uncharacterized protein N7483_011647 [Penicillium malachiteum]KAJ5714466.1 hypothetical protein N7483_011647 [Penicillium malachiteum]